MQTTATFGPSVQPNIFKAMQPQSAQNMYVQTTGANSSSQVRTNQTGSLYRGPSASPAPRSGARHVPMPAMYQQTMHQGVQGVVVQSFPQYQRQAFQAPPYAQYTQAMQPNYSYPYPSYYTVPTQRGAVGVSTGVGVGNTIPVQAGPNGPLTGPPGTTQTQLPLAPAAVLTTSTVPPGSSTAVLGVAPSAGGQPVAVPPMVGVVQPTVPTQQTQKPNRLRAHALEIIDPITNKNILEDFDRSKTSTCSDVEYPEQNMYVQQPIVMTEPLRNMSYDMMDIHQINQQQQRDITLGQTPVVSAMSDAPSVEILPTLQKPRSKKILPIVNPKDGNSVQNTATHPSDSLANRSLQQQQHQQQQQQQQQHHQHSTKLLEEGTHVKNSDCVQPQLPVSQSQQQKQPPYHSSTHRVPQINTNQQQQVVANANLVLNDDVNSNISKETVDDTLTDSNIQQKHQICISSTLSNANSQPINFSDTPPTSDTIQSQQILSSINASDTLNELSVIDVTALAIQQQQQQPQQQQQQQQPQQQQHRHRHLSTDEGVAASQSATFTEVNVIGVIDPVIATNLVGIQMPAAESIVHNMQLTEKLATEVKHNVCHHVDGMSKENSATIKCADQASTSNGVVQNADNELAANDEQQNNNISIVDVEEIHNNINNNNNIISIRDSISANDTEVTHKQVEHEQQQQQQQQNSNSTCIVTSTKTCDETDRVLQQQPQTSNIITSRTQPQSSKSSNLNDIVVTTTTSTIPTTTTTITTDMTESIDASSHTKDDNDDSSEKDMMNVELKTFNNSHDLVSLTDINSNSSSAPLTSAIDDNDTLCDSSDVATEIVSCTDKEMQSSLICYNEGQWSPNNPTGKRQYNREQLLQLREAKASHKQPEINNASILPTPNLLPSFVRNPKRVQSMVGALGSNRSGNGNASGIDGGGNYGNKQASMSGVHGRGSMKGMIRVVNLSLNQDVKLNETDNAWRPRVLVKSGDAENPSVKTRREKDELIRRVRGILNKLTPEKFDTLVEEIIKLKIDTPDKMEEVMVLVFEKAIDEPNFSVSYARLCHRLISEVKARDERMESGTKSNLVQFRAALLDKTEREFIQNVTKSKAKEKKLQPIIEKIAKCTDPLEKAELEEQLEEEERKIRRRSGGTVRFIGELFKISMLTGKIINSCIEALLNPNSEDQLECLCKLLTTVGAKFEQTPINVKESSRCFSLEKITARMQAIASKTDKEGAKISSRVRFMLQDVIDLRRDKWQSKRNEAPKTMSQVEKEMKTEQLSLQYYNNYAGPVSGAGGGGGGSNVTSPLVSGGKRDERTGGGGGGGRYNDSRSGYGGSHSQRGDTGSLRRQQQGGGGGDNSADGVHSNSNNDDNAWLVQTSKGSRCLDTNKLGGITSNANFDMKKMGGLSQFAWSQNIRQSSIPTSTPTNSFAALSTLSDNNRNNDRDRERDRDRSGGPRNKGSYNKGSIERDRYGMHSRSGSSQTSRENSSSRGPQTSRGLLTNSVMQKSINHSKYTQPQMPTTNRLPAKLPFSATGSSSLYSQRGVDSYSASNQPVDIGTPAVAPIAVFEKLNDSDNRIFKSVVSEMLEIASNSKTLKNSIEPCITRLKESQRTTLLYYIMTDYLHLRNVGKLQRRYLGNIVVYLINNYFISRDHFLLAYKQFGEIASDLSLDIPDLWKYIIEFTGPLVSKRYITIYDLWNKQMKDSEPNFGKKFLKTFLDYCLTEIGPSFTRTMWKKTDIKWTDFMEEIEVKSFIQTNKFEYIENEEIQPTIVTTEYKDETIARIADSVEHLLKAEATADCIIDYINGNLVDIDKQFIRCLATKLCDHAISYKDNSYKLDTDCFQKICIPVLQRYVDSKEERELECLYSMQLLVACLEHPRGLLSDLFVELYDAYVIAQDSFIKWRDSKDQSTGKGVAVKGLNPFFTHVLSSETSDDNN